jgi:hypothetical protein
LFTLRDGPQTFHADPGHQLSEWTAERKGFRNFVSYVQPREKSFFLQNKSIFLHRWPILEENCEVAAISDSDPVIPGGAVSET